MNKMHHIGIIMPTKKQASVFIQQFGYKEDYREFVPAYHADCIFLKNFNNDTPIELIIPHNDILGKFNNGKGGIHHIAYEVKDINQTRTEYINKGIQLLEGEAVKGAGNILVNFIHPHDACGILVEFVQIMQ